ncbi:MAG: RagB/SusD family nutrient uptake outer membrane protein [Chitinophagaceae bacterium]|nr:MAG: RagB/SusD family nutrient uptake outer membrane protein [Chitinophagaceae bacterium]
MKNLFIKLSILIVVMVVGYSCKKGLDYRNNRAIDPAAVWTNASAIQGFLSDIYGSSMPGWPLGSGQNSDEGINAPKTLTNYQKGVISVSTTTVSLSYGTIEKCNFLMDQLAKVPTSVLSTALNNQYTGEAKFWRAWSYWGMVRYLGGVPLILHTQNYQDTASLKVPRSKTSDCIAQIIKDLDSAILLLPTATQYSAADYGRITKAAAMGLKGRILMWWASPLFNPTNDQTRWENAYDACNAAVQEASSEGYGLLDNYRDIWYSGNKELIMVNQYYYPDHYMNFAPIRAYASTNGAANSDQPLLSLLLAYPKRDGSPMEFDKTQLSNPAYNAQFLTDFYLNRDDRFYATVYFGGTPYPMPETKDRTWWAAWQWDAVNNKYNSISASPTYTLPFDAGITGFFDRKGLDTSITGAQVPFGAPSAKSWWSPMRYAELLMNYAECANEIGKSSEALNVLYQIRARANISPGPGGNYGITATTQADIRTAIMNERQVEFAFEGFRAEDLRRWKRYDILNNEGARHGLYVTLNPGAPLPTEQQSILDPAVRANFSAVYIDNLDGDPNYKFNYDLNHWFYAIPPSQISQEPAMLPQNKDWGGTFDPLQ